MNSANIFNAEITLNEWLETQLDALTPPSWFGAFPLVGNRLVLNAPEVPARIPAYSLHHITIDVIDRWQGRRGDSNTYAQEYQAFMAISAWVKRTKDWAIQKRWMSAALADIINKTTQVEIKDYQSSLTTPTATGNFIDINKIEARQIMEDMNPDISRDYFLVKYCFILRSDR